MSEPTEQPEAQEAAPAAEPEPIRFTGDRYRDKRPVYRNNYKHGMAAVWVYRTNYGGLTIDEMAAVTGIKRHTLNTRLQRYGLNDEYVFSKTALPQGGNQSGFLIGKPKRSPESIKVGTWDAANL